MELFLESFPKIFISGIVITLPLALVSFIIAMLLAIVCAMIQYAKVPIAKNIVQFYIWIFRGTPMLVQLFIMYFGMQSIGVRISAITAAIIVFSLDTFNKLGYKTKINTHTTSCINLFLYIYLCSEYRLIYC